MSDSDTADATYHVVDPAALAGTPDHPCDRQSVSEALDLSLLALATYSLEPGEQLSRSYHYHELREESFYVIRGPLMVETPEREYQVPTGQLFVAEPGSPHRAFNPVDADESVAVLGVGAPGYDPAKPYERTASDRK